MRLGHFESSGAEKHQLRRFLSPFISHNNIHSFSSFCCAVRLIPLHPFFPAKDPSCCFFARAPPLHSDCRSPGKRGKGKGKEGRKEGINMGREGERVGGGALGTQKCAPPLLSPPPSSPPTLKDLFRTREKE